MLVSHRDDLTVAGPDLVEAGDALEERSPPGHGRPGAFAGQREDRNRLTRRGEHVYPLVTVLKRQVDARMPGNATPRRKTKPGRPGGVARAWRALQAVRDAVRASAAVAPVVREAVARVIWRELFRAGPAVFLVALRLLPPPEPREVQGMPLFEEP